MLQSQVQLCSCGRYAAKCVFPFMMRRHQIRTFYSSIGGLQRSKNICHDQVLADSHVSNFQLEKVLLMRKVTRYEYERHHLRDYSENELKEQLESRGSDYKALLLRHNEYKQHLDHIREGLERRKIQYRTISRFDSHHSLVDWCDAVITAGGDGTFLMAASMIPGMASKPVIGINTDPVRSEGYLCLPKQYSARNSGAALDRLLENKFKWKWRQRIRITMSGENAFDDPVDLISQKLNCPEYRFSEHVKENEEHSNSDGENSRMIRQSRILPILALNEVFVGESLSARVSFCELAIDGREREKSKSSGITICTGTGSTSWFFNINHLTKESVKQILTLAQDIKVCENASLSDPELLETITKKFNSSLTFDPSVGLMAYCIRDPIRNAVFHVKNEKGFCKRMTIRSRMWDGWIVVDGGLSFKFNNGAMCEFEIRPEDALRCVKLD